MNQKQLILVGFLLLFVSVSFARQGDAWANASLPYRLEYNITSATTLTDYQVMLNLTYYSGMKSDFSDIRFYLPNGTKLSYYIEQQVNNSWALVWVRMPVINTTSYIYVYYGNQSATSESNGTATFILFDDFNTYNLGNINGQNGWTTRRVGGSGTASIVDYEGRKQLRLYSTSEGTTIDKQLLMNGTKTILYTKRVGAGEAFLVGYTDGGYQSNGYYTNGYNNMIGADANTKAVMARVVSSAETRIQTISDSTPAGYYRMQYGWAGNNLYTTRNFTTILNTTDTQYSSRNYLALTSWTNVDHYISHLFVARAATTEPTIQQINLETNAPDLWANNSLIYRQRINITSSTTLNDYQVMLNVSYRSGMNTNFSDMRFYLIDGTKLPYWIEQQVNGSWALTWVRMPFITNSSFIYMYYGNPNAVSESNGTATFILFDDFNTYNLGNINGQNGWTTRRVGGSGTASIVDYEGRKQLRLYSTESATTIDKQLLMNGTKTIVYTKRQSSSETLIILYTDGTYQSNGQESNGYDFTIGGWSNTYSRLRKFVNNAETHIQSVSESWPAGYYRMQYGWAGNNLYATRNFTTLLNATDTQYSSRNYLGLIVWSGADHYISYLFVAKAATTEPATAFGQTENIGVIILYPTNNQYLNVSTFNVNFTLGYNETGNCRLYDGATLKATLNGPFTAGQNYTFSNQTFTDGARTMSVNCSTAPFNASVNIIVDATPPSISITQPLNNSVFGGRNINIIGSVSDLTYNYSNISIWQGSNLINSTTTTNSSFNVTLGVQNDGYYNITVMAFDLAGNRANRTHAVYADTTPPSLSVNYSFQNWQTVDYGTQIQLNFSASDINFNYISVRYSYLNGTLIQNWTYTTTNGSINITLLSTTDRYIINVTAFDLGNNQNTSVRYVKTFDYTAYNNGLNTTVRYLNNSNCYERFVLNNITYYYPKTYENGTFIDSSCKIGVSGIRYNNAISFGTLFLTAGLYEGAYSNFSFITNYDFSKNKTFTVLIGELNFTNLKTNQSIVTNTTRTTYFSGTTCYYLDVRRAFVSFLTNGSICIRTYGRSTPISNDWPTSAGDDYVFGSISTYINSTTCIDGYSQEGILIGTFNDGTWGLGCTDYLPTQPLSDYWLFNESFVPIQTNSLHFYINKTPATFGNISNPINSHLFTLLLTDRQFYVNASVMNPIIIPKINNVFFIYRNTTEQRYQSNIVTTNGQLIKPRWISYLGTDVGSGKLTLYRAYSPSTFISNLIPNQAAIVQDENTNVCYFVPAYSPTNLSILQTMVGYSIPCESIISQAIDLPLVPQYVYCYKSNTSYIVNVTSQYNMLHKVEYTNINNISSYDGEYGKNFYRSYNLAVYPKINYSVANTTYCYYDDRSTSLLGLPKMNISTEIKNMVITPLLIMSMGLSIYNPFVFMMPVAINDTFQIFSVTHMILFGILLSISAFVFAHNTTKTLKNSFIYIAILIAYISTYSMYTDIPSTAPFKAQVTSLQGNMTAFTTALEPNRANLYMIIINSVDLAVSMATFIVSFPLILINLIFGTIVEAVPMLSPVLSVFSSMLMIGIYMWIIIKIYEILKNQFKEI